MSVYSVSFLQLVSTNDYTFWVRLFFPWHPGIFSSTLAVSILKWFSYVLCPLADTLLPTKYHRNI